MRFFSGYGDGAGRPLIPSRRTLTSSPLPNRPTNALAAVSKDMQAVKPCSNNALHFLTGVPANAGCPI